jgi:hypothetical protein
MVLGPGGRIVLYAVPAFAIARRGVAFGQQQPGHERTVHLPAINRNEVRCESGLSQPGIQQHDAERFEVGDVSGDDSQTVSQRRRGNQRIAFRAWVRNVEARAALGDCGIDRQDTTVETRQDLFVYPTS